MKIFRKILSNPSLVVILVITLISFGLRFYKLETLPGAFFGDEAALGYNAWSIATTFKDEYGKFLPITFRSFDDYKPGIYIYLTIPWVMSFGLNQFSARATAAFFGSLLPLAIYLLIKRIGQKNKIQDSKKINCLALFAALIVALSPWHIEVSRTAIEAGVALTFTILSLYLILGKSKKSWISGLILGLVTLYTYHTARLITPILLLSTQIFKLDKKNKSKIISFSLLVILGLALAFFSSKSRFAQISIFNDLGGRLKMEEAIREDGGPIAVPLWQTRIFHNKVWTIILNFTNSYLTNTSFEYLFMGGAQPPRVTIPETGQFLLFTLPFFVIGLIVSFRNWQKHDQWLLAWLLVAPIPASLTTAEIPHTYRTLFMLPVISIYIAMGLVFIFNFFKKNYQKLYWFITPIIFFAITYNFAKAWHQYTIHQQVHQPWYRQYGYKDLFNYLNNIDAKEKITITTRENEPYIFYLFYNQVKPRIYQQQAQKRLGHKEIEAGAISTQIFNYVFSEKACPHDLNDNNPNNYYVVIHTCELPIGFERIKTIDYLDGNPEFHVDRPMDPDSLPAEEMVEDK